MKYFPPLRASVESSSNLIFYVMYKKNLLAVMVEATVIFMSLCNFRFVLPGSERAETNLEIQTDIW